MQKDRTLELALLNRRPLRNFQLQIFYLFPKSRIKDRSLFMSQVGTEEKRIFG